MLFAVLTPITINQTIKVTKQSDSSATKSADIEEIEIDFTDMPRLHTAPSVTAKALEKQVDKLVADFNKLADTLNRPKFVDPASGRKTDSPSKDSIAEEKKENAPKTEDRKRESQSIRVGENRAEMKDFTCKSPPEESIQKEKTVPESNESAHPSSPEENDREEKTIPETNDSVRVSKHKESIPEGKTTSDDVNVEKSKITKQVFGMLCDKTSLHEIIV